MFSKIESNQKSTPIAPKEFHFIWVGGDVSEKYLLNLRAAVTQAEKMGYKVNLWLSNPKQFHKTAAKMDINFYDKIKLRDINELTEFTNATFPEKGKEILSRIRQEMAGNKNYSAAADWLRVLILLKEGGVYSDIDHIFLPRDEANGLDIQILAQLPEDLTPFKNQGVIVDNIFHCLTEINGKQQTMTTPVVNMERINELLEKSQSTKCHLTPTEFLNCIGKPCPVIPEQNRVNWTKEQFQKNKPQSQFDIDLPHGIKILGDHFLLKDGSEPKMKNAMMGSLGNGSVISKPDNCLMAAIPGSKVLEQTLLKYLANYDRISNGYDPAYVLNRKVTANDLAQIGKTHFIHDVNALKEGEGTEVLIGSNAPFYIYKNKEGELLLFKQSSHNMSELEMKRAPDTMLFSSSYGRRMISSNTHALTPILITMKEVLPEANLSDLLIPPSALAGNIQLHWDNTWFGDPSLERKPAFTDSDAHYANTFGRTQLADEPKEIEMKLFSYEEENICFSRSEGTHVQITPSDTFEKWFSELPLQINTPLSNSYSVFKLNDDVIALNKGPGTPGVQIRKMGDIYQVYNNISADSGFERNEDKKSNIVTTLVDLNTALRNVEQQKLESTTDRENEGSYSIR
ncbi:TcdA/TcdB catalytic glycosyltransferase domain-containing protein [Legionella maioricensis]|uniref:GT44 domain-containing protein n=1 Tax=Legionella maioricensis TaxID=2896528 RepID=A0A9X2D3R4_9GAMM|nr:TcdA/TcdB catalytic glycosyltransferase domain-containing protein [Legionella maioricensis]MCL9685844.1 hypothetical protein [Legionella maioricensis]MCL9689250.1 hypothetical protein [Legionella maioricensis]